MHPRHRSKPALRDQPLSKRRRPTPSRALRYNDDDGNGDGDGRGLHLACPFYKASPTLNTRCLLRNCLTSTSFVVQHLHRCHSGPDPDPVSTSAEDAEDAGQLTLRDAGPTGRRLDKSRQYLDKYQLAAVRESPRRGLNEEERWFAIWKIVFPGKPRPESAYVANPEEEILRIARQAIQWDDPFGYCAQLLNRLDWITVSKTFERKSSGQLPDQSLGGAGFAPLATELGGPGAFCSGLSYSPISLDAFDFTLSDALSSYGNLWYDGGEKALESPPTTTDSYPAITFSGSCEKENAVDCVIPFYQATN